MKLHTTASRPELIEKLGHEFNPAKHNNGYSVNGSDVCMFVTLKVDGDHPSAQYNDGFINRDRFRWISQASRGQDSKQGEQVRDAGTNGLTIRLFVRPTAKTRGKATPFTYLGTATCSRMTGDKPFTASLDLADTCPDDVYKALRGRG